LETEIVEERGRGNIQKNEVAAGTSGRLRRLEKESRTIEVGGKSAGVWRTITRMKLRRMRRTDTCVETRLALGPTRGTLMEELVFHERKERINVAFAKTVKSNSESVVPERGAVNNRDLDKEGQGFYTKFNKHQRSGRSGHS